MSDSRDSQDNDLHGTSLGDWPEKMKLSQAHKFLGVSVPKMTALVKSGRIKYEEDPLDGRVKLVRRADLEALKRQRTNIA